MRLSFEGVEPLLICSGGYMLTICAAFSRDVSRIGVLNVHCRSNVTGRKAESQFGSGRLLPTLTLPSSFFLSPEVFRIM